MSMCTASFNHKVTGRLLKRLTLQVIKKIFVWGGHSKRAKLTEILSASGNCFWIGAGEKKYTADAAAELCVHTGRGKLETPFNYSGKQPTVMLALWILQYFLS